MKIRPSQTSRQTRTLGPSALCALIIAAVTLAHANKSAASPNAEGSAKLPPAKEIIAKFVQSIGGKEAYAKIQSQEAKGKFELAAQGINGSLEVLAKRPNKFLVKVNMPAIGDILTGYDGKVGWSVDALTGPSVMEGKQLEQMREQADFNHVLHDEKDFKSMETVEKSPFDGKDCYKLKLVKKNDSESTEYYEVKTGLLVGIIATQESPLGPLVVTNILSDYKKFGGVLFATKIAQKMGPIEQVMTITTFELNKVADSVFELPEQIKGLIRK